MKKCEYCVEDPCCDFCRMFNFNGNRHGVYINKGYCVLHERATEPIDVCNDFICMNYKVLGEINKKFKNFHAKG